MASVTGAGSAARRAGMAFLQVGAACCLASVAAFFLLDVVVRTPWHHTFDLRVYRGAVQWWLDGRPLYDFIRPHTSLGFTYPPFAVLCLLPLGLGTETTATALITIASSVAILVTTTWLVAPVARRRGWPVWFAVAVAVPVAVAMEPVRETLGWGQVNLLLALLVLTDGRALQRGRPWAGVGIGLASAIKLTPALFVVYLAVTRRSRATAVAAGTAVGATLLAFVVDPSASVTYWTRSLWETDRIGPPVKTGNQSILGLLSRLAAPQPPSRVAWAVLVAAVAGIGLWRAARAARHGDEFTGITITGLTACLVSPISWSHHLYWVVPAAVVLLDRATGTPSAGSRGPWLRDHPRSGELAAGVGVLAVVTAFAVSLIWYFAGATTSGRGGPVGVLGENAYMLIMTVLLVALPARLPAAPSAARTSAPPRPGGSSPR
jgi:alpha-1,2-mannosyltransferase